MNKAGGRFTHGCLVVCGVLTVVFLLSQLEATKMEVLSLPFDIYSRSKWTKD